MHNDPWRIVILRDHYFRNVRPLNQIANDDVNVPLGATILPRNARSTLSVSHTDVLTEVPGGVPFGTPICYSYSVMTRTVIPKIGRRIKRQQKQVKKNVT